MNRRLACCYFLVGCAFAVGTGWLYRAIRDSGYTVLSSQLSPSGGVTISALSSTSEAGHAPYGQYLVLSSKPEIDSPNDGYVVFAGYCHEGLSFSWKSDTEVSIRCDTTTPNPVQTLASKAFGIDIHLDLVQGPHE